MARKNRRLVEDFEAVLRAISRQNRELIVLVGGHAVNVWALTYQVRLGQSLLAYQPLTSADVDVYATRNALLALHQELAGRLRLSGPREITEGTLVIGVEPDTREIDALRSVNGLGKITAQDSLLLRVCGCDVPVLFPHLLLKAKLENALHLNQAERQDVKHVKILALVLREFLAEVVSSATAANERPALRLVQEAVAVLDSPSAREFTRQHGTPLIESVPLAALIASPLPKLALFAKEEFRRRH